MKAILVILTLGALAVSCSSKDKKEMTKMKDQSVKAMEKTETKAETVTKEAMVPDEGSIMKMECKLNKDMRGISVDKNGANGCAVNYTKNGETKQVGRSAVGKTYCEEIANRITTNLKNAGFSCQ